ncbi:ferric reductase-like transmembrane domain-containing protein [Pseudomonas panipatensis]|uniref:ferric reductase-like transmembrane domain-containing protein n=1 Tax=Pseudomonas panipatensis TaxID=428992 RepID=UPI0035B1F9CC
MSALTVRIALFCLLPFGAIFLLGAMPGVAAAWDFANVAGFIAGALFLLLFGYTGRPLAQPRHDGKFFMVLHRDLSFAAAVLLAAHVGVLLWDEPLVLDELRPGAPWHMLAGTAATLLLLAIVPLSLPAVRRRLWRKHQDFRRLHYLGCALIVLLGALHMIGAGYYSGAPWKAALWCLLSAAALTWPLLPRATAHHREGPRRRHTRYLASRLGLGVLLFGLLLAGGYALLSSVDLPLL